MNINKNLVKNGDKIAEKLIRAIEKDTKIISSGSLSYPAIKNNLPAICNTIVKAIANNNLSLLALWEEDQGNEHGLARSGQDFAPEEIVREFFLLKQIVLAELKDQLITNSPTEIIEQVTLVDLVINRVMENSFQSYAEARKKEIDSLHQQIFFTNQEITRLISEYQDILAYLVHEIKNPLTSIIGYSALYLRQQRRYNTSNNNLQHIKQVLQQGRNILRLINDTLEISSYHKGDWKLRLEQVNVCTLLEDITLAVKPSIDAKKLNLITSCTPEELVIESDYLRLQQIITNLLTNAVRYTTIGEIKLTCYIKEPNLLEIRVSDTGIGIAESDRDCIFEPYFRSEKSQENVLEGVGLGLAIVSQLVNMLRGKIELISKLNIGSTFIVTIPLNLPK